MDLSKLSTTELAHMVMTGIRQLSEIPATLRVSVSEYINRVFVKVEVPAPTETPEEPKTSGKVKNGRKKPKTDTI